MLALCVLELVEGGLKACVPCSSLVVKAGVAFVLLIAIRLVGSPAYSQIYATVRVVSVHMTHHAVVLLSLGPHLGGHLPLQVNCV